MNADFEISISEYDDICGEEKPNGALLFSVCDRFEGCSVDLTRAQALKLAENLTTWAKGKKRHTLLSRCYDLPVFHGL